MSAYKLKQILFMTTKLNTTFISSVAAIVGLAAAALMFAFSTQAQADVSTNKSGSGLEVMIASNGRTLVRGAEVTNVSGSVVTARTEWGQSALTWSIHTDTETNFVTKKGSSTDRSDIEVGDTVSFSGSLDEGAGAFAVSADVVKNWSLDKDDTDRHDSEKRAETKVEVKSRWDEWKHKFPVLGWFGNKGDR